MDHKRRRERLCEVLKDGEVILIFSGKSPMCSEDEAYPFSVDRNFYYLTGIDREAMVLCLYKTNGQVRETMFIEPYDELMAKWVGPKLKSDEVKAISGVQNVMYLDELKPFINRINTYDQSYSHMSVYLDLWRYEFDQQASEAEKFADHLKATYRDVEIKDIRGTIAKMRMIKDADEIEEIKKAIAITKDGVEAMMRFMRPGINEMVIDKVFDLTLATRGCQKVAFKTIAAGGQRATTLHYSDNDQVLEDGTLFLCDLGATSKLYCADISRTFPVNGKFTARQKEIYDAVLSAQKLVTSLARPGVTIRELNDAVKEHYRKLLPELHLTGEVEDYYFHGIGHHLGLDTHDITNVELSKLEPGMVITNEPGLYIAEEGIGIRIEDDLLITEDGCIDLACDLPHTTEEIEALMKH